MRRPVRFGGCIMAELSAFRFQPAANLLVALDARCKLFALVLFSLCTLKTQLAGITALGVAIVGLAAVCRLPLQAVIKDLRYFFIFLLLVLMARALSTGGKPLLDLKIATLTRQGLYAGALISLRLLMVVLLGWLFVASTRTSQIKAAVQWFMRPLPFVPEKKVGLMIGLVMRFMPLIFDQAIEISFAQRARGIENRKNPLYRLRKFAVPLLRRIFENADQLVTAMEARAYSENRTDPVFTPQPRDWFTLAVVVGLCGLLVFL